MRIKKTLLGKMDKKRFIKSFHRLCAHGIVFASVFVLFHDPEAVQNNGKDLLQSCAHSHSFNINRSWVSACAFQYCHMQIILCRINKQNKWRYREKLLVVSAAELLSIK